MSRSSFFNRSARETGPLLPQNTDDVFTLQDLSPRPSPNSRSPAASPSPPPSFYRANNKLNNDHIYNIRSSGSSQPPSPSRTKPRKIQFAAPPPPIAGSVLVLPSHDSHRHGGKSLANLSSSLADRSRSPHIRKGSRGVDPLLGLERRERAIQNELQLLLDAQSAGLVQGFRGTENHTGRGGDASSDAGSSTPTSRSMQRSMSRGESHGGIVPIRQPKKKVVGLRGARRALLRDMGELVGIKMEEVGVLVGEIERREMVLRQVTAWQERIESFRRQLDADRGSEGKSLEEGDRAGEEDLEISELKIEERAVANEIREMEDRLAQMKARKMWLGERIQQGVNRREAKLSSYRGALREVESEVKIFLRSPPVAVSVVMGNDDGFMALPPPRRTLEMAREWWDKEISQLQIRKQKVEIEKAALEEGAKMWDDCASQVMEFEDDLRKQMAGNEVQGAEMLRKQIGKMHSVVETLEENAKDAEERGWNLLICAVGAELEAFKEGELILKGALEMFERSERDSGQQKDSGGDENVASNNCDLDEANGKQLHRGESTDREDSEDDGPNLAELLVDRGDGDDTS